jgi:hypothetical protein
LPSIAGVVQTAPPSRPFGTVNALHRSFPVRAFSATTVPRVETFGSFNSPYSAEVPMNTVPFQTTALP